MDDDKKRKVAQLVAGIVVSDDDLAPEEDAFVDKMLAGLGLSSDDREHIFPIIDGDEAAESFRSLDKDIQEQAFAMLLEAACADGVIADEERAYLGKVGAVVGMDERAVSEKLEAALKAAS